MALENINFGKISEDLKVFDPLSQDDKLKISDFFFCINSDTHEEVFATLGKEEFIKEIPNIEEIITFLLGFGKFLLENKDDFEVSNLLDNIEASEESKIALNKIFSKESNYYKILKATFIFDKFTDTINDFHYNCSVSYGDNDIIFILSELRFKLNNTKLKFTLSKESALEFKNKLNESLDNLIEDMKKLEDINQLKKIKIIK